LTPIAYAAIAIPSMTMCGLNIRRSRSLQVPGSPSSELQTRYFAPGNWRGMKLHLSPVGKPAPPRPRRPDALTSAITCSGVIPLPSPRSRSFFQAWKPPRAS
jgi:hypothetical protein